MLPQLLLLAGLGIATWLLFGFLKSRYPRHAAKILAGIGAVFLLLIGLVLLLTGKLAGLAAIGAGLWLWVQRAMKAHALWRSLRAMMAGQSRDGQRPAGGAPPPPARDPGGMSVEEARDILGLGPDADTAAIKAAHRRLMEANHPDRGGSTWVAARLNQARDRLLS